MRRGALVALLAVVGVVVLTAGSASAQMSRSELLARGYKLPKQWGLGIVYYSQKQPYKIDSLVLGLPGFDPAAAQGLEVDSRTNSFHLVFDYWVLPFLNLELLGGRIDGTTEVGLSGIDIGVPLENIDVDYDGLFYGAGVTLAAGGKRYFTSLTAEYSNTRLSNEDSSVSAWVLIPRVGMNVGKASDVYVGGMYQRPDERHKGTYDVPFVGSVPYDVELSGKYGWNVLAGAHLGLAEHWTLTVEGGFGKRDSALAYLSYRW